ncbi:hypothetical protein CSKR_111666 [Clonorchis sinensis]|uniref:Uncharacterized protein n=1 Tax=Clonorchis sinensis TaxID=79923 RepID=A0A419Q6W3_CLOSI|nr:hypothetical protein CSKR_111666 [Clonorchis sinensis]
MYFVNEVKQSTEFPGGTNTPTVQQHMTVTEGFRCESLIISGVTTQATRWVAERRLDGDGFFVQACVRGCAYLRLCSTEVRLAGGFGGFWDGTEASQKVKVNGAASSKFGALNPLLIVPTG